MSCTLSPATQAKIESARSQLDSLEETGNPQYAYYAIQTLTRITKLESDNWNPDTNYDEEEKREGPGSAHI